MTFIVEWTQKDFKTILSVIILVVVHYLLRQLKGTSFEFLYKIWCTFWLLLLAILTINFVKERLKKWWNE
jgi:hypothetical protein